MAGVDYAIFGIAAARRQRADRLADEQRIDPFAQRDHLTRHLQPEQRRGARRRGIEPAALDAIGPVDPGISDRDQHFARAGARDGQRRHPQHLWPAGRVERCCAHRLGYRNLPHLRPQAPFAMPRPLAGRRQTRWLCAP